MSAVQYDGYEILVPIDEANGISRWQAQGPDGPAEMFFGPPELLDRVQSLPTWAPFAPVQCGHNEQGQTYVIVPGALNASLTDLAWRLGPGPGMAFLWHVAAALAELHDRAGAHGAIHPDFVGIDADGYLSIRPALSMELPADPDTSPSAQATDSLLFASLVNTIDNREESDEGIALLREGLTLPYARIRLAPGRAIRQTITAIVSRKMGWERLLIDELGVGWSLDQTYRPILPTPLAPSAVRPGNTPPPLTASSLDSSTLATLTSAKIVLPTPKPNPDLQVEEEEEDDEDIPVVAQHTAMARVPRTNSLLPPVEDEEAFDPEPMPAVADEDEETDETLRQEPAGVTLRVLADLPEDDDEEVDITAERPTAALSLAVATVPPVEAHRSEEHLPEEGVTPSEDDVDPSLDDPSLDSTAESAIVDDDAASAPSQDVDAADHTPPSLEDPATAAVDEGLTVDAVPEEVLVESEEDNAQSVVSDADSDSAEDLEDDGDVASLAADTAEAVSTEPAVDAPVVSEETQAPAAAVVAVLAVDATPPTGDAQSAAVAQPAAVEVEEVDDEVVADAPPQDDTPQDVTTVQEASSPAVEEDDATLALTATAAQEDAEAVDADADQSPTAANDAAPDWDDGPQMIVSTRDNVDLLRDIMPTEVLSEAPPEKPHVAAVRVTPMRVSTADLLQMVSEVAEGHDSEPESKAGSVRVSVPSQTANNDIRQTRVRPPRAAVIPTPVAPPSAEDLAAVQPTATAAVPVTSAMDASPAPSADASMPGVAEIKMVPPQDESILSNRATEGEPLWGGVKGVTNNPNREKELGLGKWTEPARSADEIRRALPGSPPRAMDLGEARPVWPLYAVLAVVVMVGVGWLWQRSSPAPEPMPTSTAAPAMPAPEVVEVSADVRVVRIEVIHGEDGPVTYDGIFYGNSPVDIPLPSDDSARTLCIAEQCRPLSRTQLTEGGNAYFFDRRP